MKQSLTGPIITPKAASTKIEQDLVHLTHFSMADGSTDNSLVAMVRLAFSSQIQDV